MLRFHTQTAGVQLTAQQPEVNLTRVTMQALAAVLGGTQSLHTNAYDEAIALPSQKAARLAVRTQQVIANETDLTATVDPFAGSYAMESMTDDVADAADELMARVEDLGGAVAAIEQGFQKAEIERSAYQVTREIDAGERVVVGVNKFTVPSDEPYEPLRLDPGDRAAAGPPAGHAAQRAGRRRGQPLHRRAEEGRHRQPEPAGPAARGAAAPRHGGRSLRRAARGLGPVPAARPRLTRTPGTMSRPRAVANGAQVRLPTVISSKRISSRAPVRWPRSPGIGPDPG